MITGGSPISGNPHVNGAYGANIYERPDAGDVHHTQKYHEIPGFRQLLLENCHTIIIHPISQPGLPWLWPQK